jgi:hypothetical protein
MSDDKADGQQHLPAKKTDAGPPGRVDATGGRQVPQDLGPLIEIAREFIGAMRDGAEGKKEIALRRIEAEEKERVSEQAHVSRCAGSGRFHE